MKTPLNIARNKLFLANDTLLMSHDDRFSTLALPQFLKVILVIIKKKNIGPTTSLW